MSEADVAAVVLWLAVTLYAVLAGADFGAGFWDLIAGGPERGRHPRALIDRVLTPIWESNHVWLIFMLVVTWTAFPDAFGPIMRTLFVPLFLAALGIVLRGAGFAFRHLAQGVQGQRAMGAIFASSSVITPFFMGTVVGAIATGRVPAEGAGDRFTSWFNLPSIVIGLLVVANCAYLASVYLVHEAHDDAEMRSYFRVRALAAGGVAGAMAVLGLIALHADARDLFDDLVSDALPLILLSAACGIGTLVQLARGGGFTRPLAVGAVATVVWGWGVAQSPYLLPGQLTIDQAAAPDATMTALFVVFGAALLLVVPSIVLLLTLQQRGRLGEDEAPHD